MAVSPALLRRRAIKSRSDIMWRPQRPAKLEASAVRSGPTRNPQRVAASRRTAAAKYRTRGGIRR